MKLEILYVRNKGPNLVETNYWSSEYARNGIVYLSWNAQAGRLLIPQKCEPWLAQMRSARHVIVSMGRWREKKIAFELLFEDDSDAPFCLHFGKEQTDRIIPESQQGGGFDIVVYTQEGEQFRFPGLYRRVEKIPCGQPWVEQ